MSVFVYARVRVCKQVHSCADVYTHAHKKSILPSLLLCSFTLVIVKSLKQEARLKPEAQCCV